MTVDLRFRRPLAGAQPVDLRLGRTYSPPPPPLPEPPRGALRAGVASPWSPAAAATRPAQTLWQENQGVGGALRAPWDAAVPHKGAGVGAAWGATRGASSAGPLLVWTSGKPLQGAFRAPWQFTRGVLSLVGTDWGTAERRPVALVSPWRQGARGSTPTLAPWASGRRVGRAADAGAQQGRRAAAATRAPWQAGVPIESIGGPWVPPWTPVPPEPGCWVPEPGEAVQLLFRAAVQGIADLVFACRRAALATIPIRRVYMVTNVTTLARVSDGTPVPCLSFSLSLDVDSWAWGFSAALPASALSLIEPGPGGEPVELLATVNGIEFRVLTESMARERVFGQASVRVQGRGRTALLDAPYWEMQTFNEVNALTTQQLLDQALPSGWTAEFGLTPWLVPGGVWSHQGTPISAALAIAAAGGGYLQPHATNPILRVLPRYPSAPWTWAGVTPDIELPAAVVTREGIEWVERARYNRVYVSGTNTGVLGRVTRAGTAGDLVAQMVTDPLITHVDAARQRGLPVLAEGGRKAMVTLRLPVLIETGVLRPGQFVRYVDGVTRIGIIRSVSVESALPEVWQTIKVETHVN